ncbi:DNA mismatch repair protein MutS [Peptoclostridium litorale DSM 5388]|uniref:DNA mismatch repair protein MutS n=1 Tax=Peptoclostridium litorale DSM 5388 TaxID=1121324 RepID=A0A069REM7_PEPLI|nr:DNA mismatch repair protein MutS [Peptoclostridium litorale]KDR95248.1 DNA mismatch repair protein MutS [Peptoclostridium litorale DSM 5388]SIN72779.1 DNA mismatch repair protein MutS [Peptoclostridium litorale DSM 5388]
MEKLTPMMKQYMQIKSNHKDCILFFRLGDFYEMFFDDAIEASRILEIALTGKSCGLEEKAPMCGVPYHSAENYIGRLIKSGLKVAICEQTEDASAAKGLVKRDVVRVITPGTIIEDNFLENSKNNYLMSIFSMQADYDCGISYVDISTGDLFCTGISKHELGEEIGKIQPTEIIFSDDSLKNHIKNSCFGLSIYINEDSHSYFDGSSSATVDCFGEEHIANAGLKGKESVLKSIDGLLSYIIQTQKQSASNISQIHLYSQDDFMKLDGFTRRNLELTQTIRGSSKKGTLLHVLDKTKTCMGSRLLKKWVDEPLVSENKISKRLDMIEELFSDFALRDDMSKELREIYDIERLCAKIAFEKINPKELINLKNSIARIPSIKQLVTESGHKNLMELSGSLDELSDVKRLIEESILDEPSFSSKDGNIIKASFDERVKELRDFSINGANIIKSIEESEKERNGIKSLKIGFNKVFGYYIEITKTNLKDFKLPENYTRKQTLSNCERFITPELKEVEEKIISAQEKIKSLEYEIFVDIRNKVYGEIVRIQNAAKIIASFDVINSLAQVANENNYVKPAISKSGDIDIESGRHPVIETMSKDQCFIPNDTAIDNDKFIGIITGPNMAGKSTYMRQVALICLMAHIGSFVPAQNAKIPLLDRIFTRVGASDDLSQGQSTFMVEMSEVAQILNNASSKSLVILDEIGRGTSTYDGLSLAWAIVEHIHDDIGCKTLFATHYHELTELENEFPGIKNYSVDIQENGEDIVFLRRIIAGGTDKSYGIHVAKLAKLPESVIDKSKEILERLEEKKISDNKSKISSGARASNVKTIQEEKPECSLAHSKEAIHVKEQVSMFDYKKDIMIQNIAKLDIINMTPLDAMNYLYTMQKEAKMLGDD